MKIIQVFNRYLTRGGEENSVVRIANHLEEGGHNVVRFWRSSTEWVQDDRPPKWQQAILMGYNKSVLTELKQLHLEFEPDIWILHNVLPVISLGVYDLAEELGVPLVQWLHNYRPLSLSGVNPSSSKHGYLYEVMMGSWRNSRLQTAILAFHYQRLRASGGFNSVHLWVSVSDQMGRIFNDTDWFTGEVVTIRHAWDIQETLPKSPAPKPPYFLFLGRIIEEKGIRFLVDLFSRPEMSEHNLFVAGDGELKSELMNLNTPNIKWLGHVSGEHKRQLIRDSRAVLFPSIWHEPLSTIVYEAYEQERCVIASDAGGTPEIVVHQSTGLILPTKHIDAWLAVLSTYDDPELIRLGKNARQWLCENVSAQRWNSEFSSVTKQHLCI